MSDLHALVYVSSASRLLSDAELELLLVEAVAKNSQNNITGVLLYNDGNFIQYLEGPETALRETYKRITASRRHSGVICLLDQKIAQRNFSDWHMGHAKTTRSQLLELSSANWEEVAQNVTGKENPGLLLLKDFWRRR